VNTPELFAVVTALAAPERLTVEPAPRDVGLIVPVMLSFVTPNDTVVERVTAPLTPEIVTLCDPAGVCDDVVTVITELPEPLIDVGLNDADAPCSPDALRATAPLKPPIDPTLTVYVVLEGGTTVREDGVAATVKSGVTGTICRPLTGARRVVLLPVGVAVIVNPPAVIENLT
jgi:hypothetical protein